MPATMENTNVNTTISTLETTGLNKTFFDKALLEYAKKKLVYAEYGVKKRIPKNHGKKIEMRRWVPFDVNDALAPLTEGVTPEGLTLDQDIVEAVIEQYGAYFIFSDKLNLTTYDEIVQSGVKRLGELMGDVADHVVRDELCNGTNVMYGGSADSRASITANDKLSIDLIQKAVIELETLKAPKFTRNGQSHYKCIIHPKAKYDLWNDPKWESANTYVNQEKLYSGEIGRMYGCVFIVADNAPILAAGDGNSVPVYQSVIFGDDSYATVDIGGSGAIKSYINPIGQAGFDPLHQRGTVGAKIEAFTAKILNEDWVLRLEHAASLK